MSQPPERMKMFKTILIGDGAVGKTSIRRNYMGKNFISSHIETLGVDFAQKYIVHEGETVRFIIWDLAGQPSFKSVRGHYYTGCSSIILVYSVIDRKSFDNASKWLVEAYNNMGQLPPTAVIANKIDVRPMQSKDKVISTEEGKRFTAIFKDRLNVPAFFMETSALTGDNIKKMFSQLITMMTGSTTI
ncbi:MAG: Rab family GTPase [Candidatus Thorarchaeota archaeon]|jgi:small GTP-binding protein